MNKFNNLYSKIIDQNTEIGRGCDWQFSREGIKLFKQFLDTSNWTVQGSAWNTETNETFRLDNKNVRFETNIDGGTRYTLQLKIDGKVYDYSGDIKFFEDRIEAAPFVLRTYNLIDYGYDYDADCSSFTFDIGSDNVIRDTQRGDFYLDALVKIKVFVDVISSGKYRS